MRNRIALILLSIISVAISPLTACVQSPFSDEINTKIPVYTYDVVNTYPHDPDAYTQGLLFTGKALFESTGIKGQSSLRKVDLKTGRVLKRVQVPEQYFAEGLTVLNNKLFQLTWKSQKGFVYDLESFQLEDEFTYDGQGWGLATDGCWLILSDGTNQIRFLDPVTLDVERTIEVFAGDLPVNQLNELEYFNGEIYANIYRSDHIVRINPTNGRVTGVIDFTGLLAPQDRNARTDVLNGIAYDAKKNRLFITGKNWPKLYEVRLKQK